MPSVLLNNGSALNVFSLDTSDVLGCLSNDFRPSSHTVRAYDGT